MLDLNDNIIVHYIIVYFIASREKIRHIVKNANVTHVKVTIQRMYTDKQSVFTLQPKVCLFVQASESIKDMRVYHS